MAADDIPILFCGESINVPRFWHRCRYHDGGVSSRNRDKCRVSAIFRITQFWLNILNLDEVQTQSNVHVFCYFPLSKIEWPWFCTAKDYAVLRMCIIIIITHAIRIHQSTKRITIIIEPNSSIGHCWMSRLRRNEVPISYGIQSHRHLYDRNNNGQRSNVETVYVQRVHQIQVDQTQSVDMQTAIPVVVIWFDAVAIQQLPYPHQSQWKSKICKITIASISS